MTALYNLFVSIEKNFMSNECREVDKAESLAIYTKNQFLREFQRLMDQDESKTLKYQMIRVATTFVERLDKLSEESKTYATKTLPKIRDKHYTQEELEALEIVDLPSDHD